MGACNAAPPCPAPRAPAVPAPQRRGGPAGRRSTATVRGPAHVSVATSTAPERRATSTPTVSS
jgi:hypothetical protein